MCRNCDPEDQNVTHCDRVEHLHVCAECEGHYDCEDENCRVGFIGLCADCIKTLRLEQAVAIGSAA